MAGIAINGVVTGRESSEPSSVAVAALSLPRTGLVGVGDLERWFGAKYRGRKDCSSPESSDALPLSMLKAPSASSRMIACMHAASTAQTRARADSVDGCSNCTDLHVRGHSAAAPDSVGMAYAGRPRALALNPGAIKALLS